MKKLSKKVFEVNGTVYNIDVLSDFEFEKLTGLKKSEYDTGNPKPTISKKKQFTSKQKDTVKSKK